MNQDISDRFGKQKQTKPRFQPCKLYLKFTGKIKDFKKVESHLAEYFGRFGKIDDIKVLEKSDFKRRFAMLWFRIIFGRKLSSRST